ncbi:MAG: metallophosphoesterase, partial [Deltaproteobacteria bacterium]|nr:metallophosphoesterase [Deltaproteobacteria bacterium]
MSDRYLILSDLHLADVEDHPDGWKFFKGRRYLFDAELRTLLEGFRARCPGSATLLLNGDVFDFDLVTAVPPDPPWPVTRRERRCGLRPTEDKSAWKLGRILEHHPLFVDALATFLAAGNRVVHVLGNHDRELVFPGVQAVLRDALHKTARAAGGDFDEGALSFEPWFHHVPGRLYAEHGHQYDFYNSCRYLLDPVVDRGGIPELGLPMGNLSNRLLMARMGYFNPHTGDYIMGGFRYLL